MLRKAAAVAAGLAMVASFGVAGVGAATAATPALHVKGGSRWTMKVTSLGCEVESFAANGTFKGDVGSDKGTWTGGHDTLNMKWTKGTMGGATFSGTLRAPDREYEGTFTHNGTSQLGELVNGASPGC